MSMTTIGESIWLRLQQRALAEGRSVEEVLEYLLGVSGPGAEPAGNSNSECKNLLTSDGSIKLLIEPESGEVVDANAAAVAFYGYPAGQLRGVSVFDLNVLSPEEVRATLDHARREARNFFESRHRLASGELRDVHVFSRPVAVEGKTLLLAVVVDVSARREAEADRDQALQSLHESEMRYRALFEQSNDAVFIVGLDGHHLQVNQRAIELLGYPPGELDHFFYLGAVAQDEQEESARIRERLLSGERIPPYERRFCRKDGQIIDVEINAELVRNEQGAALHLQSIVRDISARKRTEAALRQSEARQRAMIEAIPDLIFRAIAFRPNRANGAGSHDPIRRACVSPECRR